MRRFQEIASAEPFFLRQPRGIPCTARHRIIEHHNLVAIKPLAEGTQIAWIGLKEIRCAEAKRLLKCTAQAEIYLNGATLRCQRDVLEEQRPDIRLEYMCEIDRPNLLVRIKLARLARARVPVTVSVPSAPRRRQ